MVRIAVERAPPSGMRGADNATRFVGEKDRAAIGRQYADDDAGRRGDHGVDLRAFALGERLGNGDDIRRMDLMRCRKRLAGEAERRGDAAAILPDELRIVIGAEADIEPRIDARRNAALTGEETVPDISDVGQAFRKDRINRVPDFHVHMICLLRRMHPVSAS